MFNYPGTHWFHRKVLHIRALCSKVLNTLHSVFHSVGVRLVGSCFRRPRSTSIVIITLTECHSVLCQVRLTIYSSALLSHHRTVPHYAVYIIRSIYFFFHLSRIPTAHSCNASSRCTTLPFKICVGTIFPSFPDNVTLSDEPIKQYRKRKIFSKYFLLLQDNL